MKKEEAPRLFRSSILLFLMVLLVPLVLILVSPDYHSRASTFKHSGPPEVERIVIVILDSLRPNDVKSFMPELRKVAKTTNALALKTCLTNFTVPCVRTILEGREAPPTSALHNFYTKKSDQSSIVSTLKNLGWTVDLLSDHTLGLYAEYADNVVNSDLFPGEVLDKDLQLIDSAIDALKQNKKKHLLILHVPGTDKVAHFTKVGEGKYAHHYQVVDKKLSDFFSNLDTKKDFFLVLGDHGHGDEGFHDKNSVAIFSGPPQLKLQEFRPDLLRSKDLLFLLNFASNTSIPEDYEGSYFWFTSSKLNPTQLRFLKNTENSFRSFGLEGQNFAELLHSQKSKEDKQGILPLLNALPSVLFFLVLLTIIFRAIEQEGTPFAKPIAKSIAKSIEKPITKPIVISISLLTLSFFFNLTRDATYAAISFRVCLILIAFYLLLKNTKRLTPLVLFLIFGSAILAFFGEPFQQYFMKGEGGDFVLIIYGSTFLLSACFAFWFFPTLLSSDKKASFTLEAFQQSLPYLSSLIVMMVLPSGAYLCNSSANFLDAFFFTVALTFFVAWSILMMEEKRFVWNIDKGHYLPIAVALFTIYLLQQSAELNWRWHSLTREYFDNHHAIAALFFFLTLTFLFLIVEKKRKTHFFLPLHLTFILGYSWMFAGLSFGSFLSSLLPSLFLATVLVLAKPLPEKITDYLDGILLFCTVYGAAWLALDGFDIANIDFSFFDSRFPNLVESFSTDFDRFLFYGLLTLPKYLPLFVLPLSVFFYIKGFRIKPLLYAIVLFLFQIATLLLDINVGVFAKNHLYAFAVDDLVFVWSCALALSIFGGMALLYQKLRIKERE